MDTISAIYDSIIFDTVNVINQIELRGIIQSLQSSQQAESTMDKNSVALIIGIITPIFAIIGGLVTWFLKSKKEELLAIEERSREKRMETYQILLEPFTVLFTGNSSDKEKEKALKKISTSEYRQAAFNLTTFGSDDMVNTYNNMMQFFYKKGAENDPIKGMKHFAAFFLASRKDVNNKKTKLQEIDMLRFLITDIEKFEEPFRKMKL